MIRRRNHIDDKTVQLVFAKTRGRCFYCWTVLPEDTLILDGQGKAVSSHRNWHVEHVVPVSRGGTDRIENLLPSCKECNMAKRTMTADEFVEAHDPA